MSVCLFHCISVSLSISEVVELLLKNDAVTNVADNKGCYPLHLAAWKGDQRIVRLLIHKGTSYPKLNEQVCFNMSCLSVCLSPEPEHTIPELMERIEFYIFLSFCLSLLNYLNIKLYLSVVLSNDQFVCKSKARRNPS